VLRCATTLLSCDLRTRLLLEDSSSEKFSRRPLRISEVSGVTVVSPQRALRIRREPQRRNTWSRLCGSAGLCVATTQIHLLRSSLRLSAYLCVATTQIHLLRSSLRLSAYLGGLCGNDYLTAERAENTQRAAEKKYLTSRSQKLRREYPHDLR
jgi:hypothetical protein